MKEYIKQLEQQNEELQQMLANTQLELANAHKKLAMKNAPKAPPNKTIMETGLSDEQKSVFLKRVHPDKCVPEFLQPVCIIFLVVAIIAIIGTVSYGMYATVENAREHREQQDNIKRWEQRIINARANKGKVEQ